MTTPHDTLLLDGIHLNCVLGVFPEERAEKRPVVVTVCLHTDTQAAAATDDLADAVDYHALTQRIIGHAERTQFNLVETLAETIARICLEDTRVRAVEVRVRKPSPMPGLDASEVTIIREQPC